MQITIKLDILTIRRLVAGLPELHERSALAQKTVAESYLDCVDELNAKLLEQYKKRSWIYTICFKPELFYDFADDKRALVSRVLKWINSYDDVFQYVPDAPKFNNKWDYPYVASFWIRFNKIFQTLNNSLVDASEDLELTLTPEEVEMFWIIYNFVIYPDRRSDKVPV